MEQSDKSNDRNKTPMPGFFKTWLWVLLVINAINAILSFGSESFGLSGFSIFSIIVMMMNQRGGFYCLVACAVVKLLNPTDAYLNTILLTLQAAVTYVMMIVPHRGVTTVWKSMNPGMDWNEKSVIYLPIILLIMILSNIIIT